MIRTQISLDPAVYRQAKRAARRQGISLAEFLRRALALALERPAAGSRPWMEFASGDPEASRTVDEIVYGTARP
jgi:hypothetical protein